MIVCSVVATSPPAHATACYWLGQSKFVPTQASFSQAVTSYNCGPTPNGGWNTDAGMNFFAEPGFNKSHVRGCRAHMVLVKDDEGPLGDLDVDCTYYAQHYDSWSIRSAGGWVVTRTGRYHFTGWINIQAGSYYNTFPYAARTNLGFS